MSGARDLLGRGGRGIPEQAVRAEALAQRRDFAGALGASRRQLRLGGQRSGAPAEQQVGAVEEARQRRQVVGAERGERARRVLAGRPEAAIGLAILVAYFRNRGSIAVEDINLLKG